MTEFIARLTEAEKWFIDGMTNQFTGYLSTDEHDAEPSDITTDNLFQIINFCLTKFTRVKGLQLKINRRWILNEDKDGIYQDIYDQLYNSNRSFFEILANNN
jgi:hypothetical protein